jgi:hypothetical protein
MNSAVDRLGTVPKGVFEVGIFERLSWFEQAMDVMGTVDLDDELGDFANWVYSRFYEIWS